MCNRVILNFSLLLSVIAFGCADSDVLEPSTAENAADTEDGEEIEAVLEEVEVDRAGGKPAVAGGETAGDGTNSGSQTYKSVQQCIAEGCASEVDACQADENCGGVYICILECDDDASCVDACIELEVEDLGTPVGDLASCVAKEGCLALPENGSSGGGGNQGGEEGDEGEDEDGDEEEGGPGGGPGGGFGGGGDDIANAIQCVFDECGPELEECFGDPDCSKVVECLTTCGADTGCLEDCGVSLDASLLGGATGAVVTCGLSAGCIDLGGFGGGGGGGGPGGGGQGGGGFEDTCGNGMCDQFEEFWCPQDCEEEGGEEEEEEDGGFGDSCGDGVCEWWEDWWCSEDCDDDGGQGGGGQGGGGQGGGGEEGSEGEEPFCGDGVCENWEVSFCPEDCDPNADEGGEDEGGEEEGGEEKGGEEKGGGEKGGGENESTYQCIVGSCTLGNCLNVPVCKEAVLCMGDCEDYDCLKDCQEGGPSSGPGASILENVVECTANTCLQD